ncbi:Clp protease N-terminal domain-containing protein [Streptomyces viridochromogenes]|uniref:Clp protease N-terminal domain-containing protein n=1 Tax=Streptomyces viridochromogenes TaxID=1938 RepID=UPI003CC80811
MQEVLRDAEALARSLGHEHVGTEHVFLAIARDAEAVPTQVLAEFVPPHRVVQALTTQMQAPEYLGETQPTVDSEPPGSV